MTRKAPDEFSDKVVGDRDHTMVTQCDLLLNPEWPES